MLNYIILLICYVSGVVAHDFHISVCEIEFDADSKALEITHRVFLDDLEETLKSWSGDQSVDVMNPKDPKALQEMIGKYFLENFAINIGNKKAELSFLGAESEDDVMYCYIELPGVRKVSSIYVTNKVLMEKFDDQMNMVHFYSGDKSASMRFSRKMQSATLYLD